MEPITLAIMAAISAGRGIVAGINKKKAMKEHDKAYDELMSQDFGMTPTARKYINEPLSANVKQQLLSQQDKNAGTGYASLGKAGARALGQVGVLNENMNKADLNIGMLEQQYRDRAMGLGAGQEFQGRAMKQNFMAQNVAGMAQMGMQEQMAQNQAWQDTARNAAMFGLMGGFSGGGTGGGVGVDDGLEKIANGGGAATSQSILDQQNARENAFMLRNNQANYNGANINFMDIMNPLNGGLYDNQENPYLMPPNIFGQ